MPNIWRRRACFVGVCTVGDTLTFFKFLVDKLRRSDLLVVRQQNDNYSPVWGDM
jgi:hypothetical protein